MTTILLPAPYFHPRAVAEAKAESKPVLMWWHHFAEVNPTARELTQQIAEKTRKAAPSVIKAGEDRLAGLFSMLARSRAGLDEVKGKVKAGAWNKLNSEWYEIMAAISVGFTQTDALGLAQVSVPVVLGVFALVGVALLWDMVRRLAQSVDGVVAGVREGLDLPDLKIEASLLSGGATAALLVAAGLGWVWTRRKR